MAPRHVPMNAGRTLVMGIVNVTPDSFSDGGAWLDVDSAVARGYRLIRDGADIIDVGGESTRPGARPLTPDQEWDRIGAVVRALAQTAVPISVDTYHSETARKAVEAGATIINDVTGGAGDPAMFTTVAALGCPYVLQHTRGTPETMNSLAHYQSVPGEVATELRTSIDRAISSGINRANIIVDPGFGFAKDNAQNWDLAAHLEDIEAIGQPLLVGVSRKRFLADIVDAQRAALPEGVPSSQPDGPEARDDATTAFTTYFAGRGVWGVRVHEVAASKAAVLTAQQLRELGGYRN